MDVIIREAIEEDVKAIRGLLADVNMFTGGMNDDRLRRAIAQRTCFVGIVDGVVVACVVATHDSVFTGILHAVAVSRKYRKQKIATALVRKTLERMENLPRVIAAVNREDESMRHTLQSWGFSAADVYGIMHRSLKDSQKY